MKNLSKCQEMMTVEQEIYQIFYTVKTIKNGIYLSRQSNATIPQQIKFIGELEEDNGAMMFFIAEKQQKKLFSTLSDCSNFVVILYPKCPLLSNSFI